MDIEKCYEILELNKDATPDQAKQAYKDLVNIWHPDRVSHNPRLKQKAEDKLKEINSAYENVVLHLSSPKRTVPKSEVSRSSYPGPTAEEPATSPHPQNTHPFQSKTETVAKPDSRILRDESVFANLWSSFSSLFHQMLTAVQSRGGGSDAEAWRESKNSGMGQGRGRSKGRGKGMGRGRGNRMGSGGRGKGRGR